MGGVCVCARKGVVVPPTQLRAGCWGAAGHAFCLPGSSRGWSSGVQLCPLVAYRVPGVALACNAEVQRLTVAVRGPDLSPAPGERVLRCWNMFAFPGHVSVTKCASRPWGPAETHPHAPTGRSHSAGPHRRGAGGTLETDQGTGTPRCVHRNLPRPPGGLRLPSVVATVASETEGPNGPI